MKNEHSLRRLANLALLGAALIWGTSFVILKNTLDSMPTFFVLALRFTGAAILMALLGIRELKKLDRGTLIGGICMGAALFLAYVFQTFGLFYTTPGKNAFLTAIYCVIVPFLYWALTHRKPDRYNIVAALLCIVGVGLVSLQSDLSVNIGDVLTVIGGFFFAVHIIVTDKYAQDKSVLLLTMMQFATAAVLCWGGVVFTGGIPETISGDSLISIAYLCIMCTMVCFLLQTFGQKHTHPSTVAILLTLESVFGTIISAIFYGETLSFQLLCGFALIFTAVILSETKLSFLSGKKTLSGE